MARADIAAAITTSPARVFFTFTVVFRCVLMAVARIAARPIVISTATRRRLHHEQIPTPAHQRLIHPPRTHPQPTLARKRFLPRQKRQQLVPTRNTRTRPQRTPTITGSRRQTRLPRLPRPTPMPPSRHHHRRALRNPRRPELRRTARAQTEDRMNLPKIAPPLETLQCLCGCFIAHHHNSTQAPCTYCGWCRQFNPDFARYPLGNLVTS